MISSSVALFSNGKPVRYDGIVLACCVLFFFSLARSRSFSPSALPSFLRIAFLDTLSFLIGSCLPLVLIDGYSQLYKRKNISPLDEYLAFSFLLDSLSRSLARASSTGKKQIRAI